MQALILAGGAGTRLRPLTLDFPKPMLDVNGAPFLLYVVNEFKNHGISEFVFCLGYLANKFAEFFGDGTKFGVQIQYSLEEGFVGTGGALKLAADKLEDEFFVVNGDTFLAVDYDLVYKQFKQKQHWGMMVIYDNHEKIAEPNIAVDAEGNVTAYIKKEALKQGNGKALPIDQPQIDCCYVDAGVQLFKKDILKLFPTREFISLEVDIFPQLIAQQQLAAFITTQRYYDLGTPERLALIRNVLR